MLEDVLLEGESKIFLNVIFNYHDITQKMHFIYDRCPCIHIMGNLLIICSKLKYHL